MLFSDKRNESQKKSLKDTEEAYMHIFLGKEASLTRLTTVLILTACHCEKGKMIDPLKSSVIARGLEKGRRRGEQKGAAG